MPYKWCLGFQINCYTAWQTRKKGRIVWGFWCTAKRVYNFFLTLGLASLFRSTKLSTKLKESWIIHLLSVCATSLLLLAWHFLSETEWRRKGTGEVPFTSLTYLSTTSIPTSVAIQFGLPRRQNFHPYGEYCQTVQGSIIEEAWTHSNVACMQTGGL